MTKRVATAVLWFMAGWTFGSMGVFFLGLPSGAEVVLSVGLAILVWDPTGRLWTSSSGGRRVYAPTAEPGAPSQLATE